MADERRDGEDGPEVSAGGVVVRPSARGLLVALAEQRDRNTGAQTVRLPKGHLEAGETLEAAALREVREETGVGAEIVQELREVRYRYFHPHRRRLVAKRVHFFLMRYADGDLAPHDDEMDRVYWCEIGQARERLSFDTERAVLAEAQALLEGPRNPRL